MPEKRSWKDSISDSQIWKSIFRHGYPSKDKRNQALTVLSNVFLHLHPVQARKSGIRMSYTWCMGGVTFFFFWWKCSPVCS